MRFCITNPQKYLPLVLVAVLLLLFPSALKPSPDEKAEAKPHVTVVFTGDAVGHVEPCG